MNNHSGKHFFISIEGIDGAGKSTVVKLLAEMMGGIAIQTPSKKLDDQRYQVEKRGIRSEKFAFYLDSLRQQKDEISEFLRTSHVICDRYIHSTIAYQWPDDTDIPQDIWTQYRDILKPDHSFLLIASQSARQNRIAEREASTGIVNVNDHDQTSMGRAHSRFFKFKGLNIIDTSDLTPDGVCTQILEVIKAGKK